MTQMVEEEKGCSGGEHPGRDMVVVGYERGQVLELASPYTPQ
jgi:hypothetical protein